MEAKKKPFLAEFTDPSGNNVFHIATKKGNCKMVDSLLKALPF